MGKIKSILIDAKYSGYCAFCGKPLDIKTEHHLLFGQDRKKAEEDGLKLPICDNCHTQNPMIDRIHDNRMAEKLSKMLGQMAFEKHCVALGATEEGAREQFRKRYGKSFL